MNRAAFDHAVRAAGAVLGESEVLVIGSQALHASVGPDLPVEAERSVEVDIAPFDDADDRKADLIDGAIGEASTFHESFGYYAQGVSLTTAVVPPGWRDRLIRYETPDTGGVVASCLEIHDLWVSKAVALRPKDIEFCRALVTLGVVDRATLQSRIDLVEGLDESVRLRAYGLTDGGPSGS